MTTFQRFFPQLGLVLVLAGSVFALPLAANAFIMTPTPTDPPTLIKHLRNELGSNDDVRQQHALVDVISLAGCADTCTIALQSAENRNVRLQNESGTGSLVDLDALVPDLLEVYRNGPADGSRLLALSALIKIGDAKALESLLQEGLAQSADVKRRTERSLASFYLNKYPELLEGAMAKKTFSVEDVRRAESMRVRLAKKEAKSGN